MSFIGQDAFFGGIMSIPMKNRNKSKKGSTTSAMAVVPASSSKSKGRKTTALTVEEIKSTNESVEIVKGSGDESMTWQERRALKKKNQKLSGRGGGGKGNAEALAATLAANEVGVGALIYQGQKAKDDKKKKEAAKEAAAKEAIVKAPEAPAPSTDFAKNEDGGYEYEYEEVEVEVESSGMSGMESSEDEDLDAAELEEIERYMERAPADVEDAPGAVPAPKREISIAVADDLSFGEFEFRNDVAVRKDRLKGIDPKRKRTKYGKNHIMTLRKDLWRAEELKERLVELKGTEEGDKMKMDAQWRSALRRASGEKVRDDTTKLRKAIRLKERRKAKSVREWEHRETIIKDNIAARDINSRARNMARKRKTEMPKRIGAANMNKISEGIRKMNRKKASVYKNQAKRAMGLEVKEDTRRERKADRRKSKKESDEKAAKNPDAAYKRDLEESNRKLALQEKKRRGGRKKTTSRQKLG